jgi:riboflavin kinase, archaea type
MHLSIDVPPQRHLSAEAYFVRNLGARRVILQGKVVSGIGNFSYWIEKLEPYYTRKTGMRLFPGTLNIQLQEPYSLPTQVIRLEGHEYGSHVSVNIVPCTINGLRAFILRTDANEQESGHHPKTIIEIATNVKLRDHFHLQDGDSVQVEVNAN